MLLAGADASFKKHPMTKSTCALQGYTLNRKTLISPFNEEMVVAVVVEVVVVHPNRGVLLIPTLSLNLIPIIDILLENTISIF